MRNKKIFDNVIRRDSCAIFGDKIDNLFVQKKFPVFMGCTTQPITSDVFMDLNWGISRCGVIQLQELVPLDFLYSAGHGSGSIGKIWLEHHTQFANFIGKYHPKSVVEIGGGHGILADCYHSSIDKFCDWTILEPNPNPSAKSKANFIKGFFTQESAYIKDFDVVIHSHVLEHIYEPKNFFSILHHLMGQRSKMIFSVPNLFAMLERKYINAINFEHSIFITEALVEKLLALCGFVIVEKEFFREDHSIFFAVEKSDKKICDANAMYVDDIACSQLHKENKKIFFDFINFYKKEILRINDSIRGKKVYLFGAHIFSQFLLASGLEEKSIIKILDNDSEKQGKRLYGSNLYVEAPEVLRSLDRPVVIVKAGAYTQEIMESILHNINSTSIFIL